MKNRYKIAVIPGDGIGPIVIEEAKKVIRCCGKKYNIDFDLCEYNCGAEYYLKTGKVWEEETFEECKRSDSILLGAIGLPHVKYENSAIFELRSGLDLYANVRPIKVYSNLTRVRGLGIVWQNTDLVIVRENTEDLYVPIRGFLTRDNTKELGIDLRIVTREGSKRVIKFAFDLCRKRKSENESKSKISHVTCVDKSNVTTGCKLFREVFKEVAKTYNDIGTEYIYVDAFPQRLFAMPQSYDVVVTTNMFGDILSGMASLILGSIGMAGSGNIGDKYGMFEPVHGSAPDILNSPEKINPIGAITSVKMMFEWLGSKYEDSRLLKSARDIELGIELTFKDNICTFDVGGTSKCSDVGSAVCERICIV